MSKHRVAGVACALAVALAPVPVVAQTIYWSEFANGRIAKKEGSVTQDVFTGLHNPSGIAVDPVARAIYWADPTLKRIYRGNLDGTGIPEILYSFTDPTTPHDVALDVPAGWIYWTDSQKQGVFRGRLDGSGVQAVVTGQPGPVGIDLDLVSRHVYWSDPSPNLERIRRADLDGVNQNVVTIVDFGNPSFDSAPSGVQVDLAAGHLYFSAFGDDGIFRTRLDGTQKTNLVPVTNPRHLALDLAAGRIYWSETNAGVLSSKLDGSNLQSVAPTNPTGIAVLPCGASSSIGGAPTPPRLQAWWTFDEPAGTIAVQDIAHPTSQLNHGSVTGSAVRVAGIVGQGLQCVGAGAGMQAQAFMQSIFIGGCGFAVEAWIHLAPGPAGTVRTIFATNSGFQFAVLDGRLRVGAIQTPAAVVGTGSWHHVAVAMSSGCVAGQPSHTTFYVDGVRVHAVPSAIGYGDPAAVFVGRSATGDVLNGVIDELSVFRSSYQGTRRDSTTIRKIWAAGCRGKRREYIRVPLWTNLPAAVGSRAAVCAQLSNLTGTMRHYGWNATSATCAAIRIAPSSGSTTVLGRTALSLSLARVAGAADCYFTAQAYSGDLTNAFFTEGGVWTSPAMAIVTPNCQSPETSQARASARAEGGDPTFYVRNDSTVAQTFRYRIEAVDGDDGQPSEDVLLDGLPPGTPVTGEVVVPPQDSAAIAVMAMVDQNNPFRDVQLVLSVDVDGDEIVDARGAAMVEAAEDTTAPVVAVEPGRAPAAALLAASPNPFREGTTLRLVLAESRHLEIGVYDVAGRRVRRLESRTFPAGSNAIVWDGRDAAGVRPRPGIYFVRAGSAGTATIARIVRLE